MNGFIKISVNEKHIEGEVHMEKVSIVDKAILLDSFRQGLHMSNEELELVTMLVTSWMFKSVQRQGIEIDGNTLEMMKHIADGLKGCDD